LSGQAQFIKGVSGDPLLLLAPELVSSIANLADVGLLLWFLEGIPPDRTRYLASTAAAKDCSLGTGRA
jgi:hypothetical protein